MMPKSSSEIKKNKKSKVLNEWDKDSAPKNRQMDRLNFSDEVKTQDEVDEQRTTGARRDIEGDSDWNMQSGNRHYSTRGQNEDYDYDEDDQEDENMFINEGLDAADADHIRMNSNDVEKEAPKVARYGDPQANTPPKQK